MKYLFLSFQRSNKFYVYVSTSKKERPNSKIIELRKLSLSESIHFLWFMTIKVKAAFFLMPLSPYF